MTRKLIWFQCVLSAWLLPAQAESGTISTLVQAVCEDQVVLLGELPSHGEAKAFQMKAQVVQRLVERCGFDRLYFEAPMYEFWGLQFALDQDQATIELLNHAMGGFWVTQELTAWRQWLLSAAKQRTLLLRGLDDQLSRTSEYARTVLPDLVAAMGENGSACATRITRNLFWQYNDANPYDQDERNWLQQCAKSAHQHFQTNPAAANPQPTEWFMANLSNLYARQAGHVEARSRDAMMQQNFLWQQALTDQPGKSIIWTAAVHAAKQQGPLKTKPLGQLLQDQSQTPVTAVGFTAFSGKSLMAGSLKHTFAPAQPGTLEHQITQHAGQASLHLSPPQLLELGEIAARLYGAFKTLAWHQHFDHVVIIREEVEPTF